MTVYFEDLYERTKNTVSSAVEHRYFVYSSSGLVATVTRTPAPGAQSTTRYMHLDNLGSIDAITEATGSGYSEKRSYDAFGARRSPQWGAAVGAFTSLTKRGFTGHESDEELGLINMKGRIFDPRIGRFLTTDPIVSHPGLGQSWNPYSYVLNNPLAYVDPSGFQEATLDSAFSSCSGCVRIDGPTTVQWSVPPIGPPPPPSNDPNETPAAWPVDLKATGNATSSPPQKTADGNDGSGGAPAWPFDSWLFHYNDHAAVWIAEDELDQRLSGRGGAPPALMSPHPVLASLPLVGLAFLPSDTSQAPADVGAAAASIASGMRLLPMGAKAIEGASSLRVTQFFNPAEGSFGPGAARALETAPATGLIDGTSKVAQTWVVPRAASGMSWFTRMMTGRGTFTNFVEFTASRAELANPGGIKLLFSPWQQVIPGGVELLGRGAVFGQLAPNYGMYVFVGGLGLTGAGEAYYFATH